MNITPLIAPKSIAVVGASTNETRYGSRVLANLLRFGYKGRTSAINRGGDQVGAAEGYRSLSEVPWPIEHVAVAVPATGVYQVLEECAALGVPAVTVFSNGFGETGTDAGREMETRLREFGRKTGIVMLGPNCNGVLNIRDRVALTSTRALDDLSLFQHKPAAPGVAIVSQSGGLAVVNVMWRSLTAGLPVEWVVSAGNQAVVSLTSLVDAAVDDDSLGAVLMILEAMPDHAQMRATAARAADRGKLLSALKIGRTSAGAQAAESHTGSLTGDFDVFRDWTRQVGVVCVEDAAELYETTMGVRTCPDGLREGIGIISISGGNVALFADLAADSGVPIPALTGDTIDRLTEILPPMCAPDNPLDLMTAVQDPAVFRAAVTTMLEDPNIGVGVLVLTLNPPGFLDAVRELTRSVSKPLWVAWVGGALSYEDSAATLRREGIVVYETMSACIRALAAAQEHGGRNHEALTGTTHQARAELDRSLPKDTERAFDAPTLGNGAGVRPTGGSEALSLVRSWGLQTVPSRRCQTRAEAVEAAHALGFPLVLKLDDPAIIHKTEVGGVLTGIRTADDCARAFDDLAKRGGAPVLVQQQVEGAVELFVAGHTQSQLGPMLSVGLGGVFVEVLQDIVRVFPPFDKDYGSRALRRLRGYQVLRDFRGSPAVDEPTLLQWLNHVGDVVVELRHQNMIIDLNPVLVPRGGGAPLVVDASLVPA